MPYHTHNQAEANRAVAEMLHKMADLVESGKASTVDFGRVVRTATYTGEQIDVEYSARIMVSEAPQR